MKFDLDEYGLDPDFCCYCGKDRAMTDRYGLPWCENHQHRGQLLNWCLSHNWPALHCSPYAIGEGEQCWYVAVIAGQDELIWMALSAIEYAETPSPVMAPQVVAPKEAPMAVVPAAEPTPPENAHDQEITRLRKEARILAGKIKIFFEETNHQPVEWKSSGRMHPNGKIMEKEYLARIKKALQVGDDLLLKDAITGMQGTLEGREK